MGRNFHRTEFHNWSFIGEGAFGKVYEACWSSNWNRPVAIKIGKHKGLAYKELDRMVQLNHPNIVQLFGTIMPDGYESECEDEDYQETGPWLVMEYVPFGSLISSVTGYPGGCPYEGMVQMAQGVAAGMQYLHHQVGLVHRDLAARNILVDENWAVKICDFGLCDNYSNHDYYYECSGRPCPIRWMPPENLPGETGRFSRKGDVWSFGVVLFEIWTRGSVPYRDLNDYQVIQTVRQGANPMNYETVNARSYVLDLMLECWAYDKTHRPNFNTIVNTLADF